MTTEDKNSATTGKPVWFITGCSTGFGHELAKQALQSGYRTVVTARQPDEVNAMAARGEALVLKLDVTNQSQIDAAIKAAEDRFGRIDVLVNNAGIARDGLAVRMKPADWQLVLKVNLEGAFLCSQQVLPGMMRNRWGRIVNISSVVGQAGSVGQANYAASKAGLIGLTKALAQEMGSRGITVNAIAPGYVATDMTKDLPEELKQKMLATIPLGRMGTPDDIADAVKFLVSDDASYITGHVLAVNGGMYM
jgi:3-oxoacyl-[acyl-carrier protein] reductase